MDAHVCPCGTSTESRTPIVGNCELCKEKWDVIEEEMRQLDERDMEEFGRLGSSVNTISILRDRWWPQTAKRRG